jgi:hypothetical protein
MSVYDVIDLRQSLRLSEIKNVIEVIYKPGSVERFSVRTVISLGV